VGRHEGPPKPGDAFSLGGRLNFAIGGLSLGAVGGALNPSISEAWWTRGLALLGGCLGLAVVGWQLRNYALRQRDRAD
jgi:hypothetical protein